MLIGLLSGAIAAIVAALLSLPLHSPDDALFNTATVVTGSLLAGVVAGLLRTALPARRFALAWAGAFAVVVATIVAAEAALVGMIAFGLPLAVEVFGITGLGVAWLHGRTVPMIRPGSTAAASVAVVLGVALAGERDQATSALALPPSASPAAATATSTAPGTSTPSATSAAATSTRAPGELPARFATRADLQNVTFTVGQGSQAQFTVNEKLAQLPLPNDAVMKSAALTGDIRLDGRPSTITLDLLQLTSDQPRRDGFMREIFRPRPSAVLTVPALTGLPNRYEAGQTVKQSVTGTLAINNVERPITFEVEARLDGATLHVLGRTGFTWKDFDMRPPNTPAVQVQDRVAVEVLLVARPRAG